jgi:hypothetical protein
MSEHIEPVDPIDVPVFLPVKDISKHFGLSQTTINRWRAADLIASVRFGRTCLIDVASVYRYLATKRRRRPTISEPHPTETKLLDAVIHARALCATAPPDQIDEAYIALNRAKHAALRHFGVHNYAHRLKERKRRQVEERRRERGLPFS